MPASSKASSLLEVVNFHQPSTLWTLVATTTPHHNNGVFILIQIICNSKWICQGKGGRIPMKKARSLSSFTGSKVKSLLIDSLIKPASSNQLCRVCIEYPR